MIQISNLMKKNGNFTLSIPELKINEGEKVAILGHNGSGKSTLFDCLTGVSVFKGNIFFNSLNIKKEFKSVIPKISYCMQNPDDQLFCSTIKEDIFFGPKNFNSSVDEEQILKHIQSFVDVTKFLNKAPYELSYGEKRLCTIAVALATDPELMIFDEPFTMLDRRQQKNLEEIISKLQKQTVFFATHNYDLAKRLASRFIVLNNGIVVYDGSELLLDENLGL